MFFKFVFFGDFLQLILVDGAGRPNEVGKVAVRRKRGKFSVLGRTKLCHCVAKCSKIVYALLPCSKSRRQFAFFFLSSFCSEMITRGGEGCNQSWGEKI